MGDATQHGMSRNIARRRRSACSRRHRIRVRPCETSPIAYFESPSTPGGACREPVERDIDAFFLGHKRSAMPHGQGRHLNCALDFHGPIARVSNSRATRDRGAARRCEAPVGNRQDAGSGGRRRLLRRNRVGRRRLWEIKYVRRDGTTAKVRVDSVSGQPRR